jgi:hypothetical protein
MKIVKNRKLFGVLNIVDIAVIAVILVIVLPMLHYYLKFNEKGFVEQKNLERFIAQRMRNDIVNQTEWRTKSLDVDVSFKNITEKQLDQIKVGDKELLPDGTVSGEIIWVGKPDPNYFIIDIGTLAKSVYARTNPGTSTYSLSAKLRLRGVVSDGGSFNYKDRPIKELAEFKFETKNYAAYFVAENKAGDMQ